MKGLLKFVLIASLIMGGLTIVVTILNQTREANDTYIAIDVDTMKLIQFDEPAPGDPIAIVDTTLGQFRFVLYPEKSPNAVKNFTELAESGYYNNTYVFNSESGAYSAAGCPQKNGDLPENYDRSRELVERELDQDLWPFRGAVCSLNTTIDRSFWQNFTGGGTYYNGSRFALINSIDFTDEICQEMRNNSGSQELTEAFIQHGGIPNFSQQMTVIGQVYEGLDVIDELANLDVSSNGVYKVPKDDIMIDSVVISTYSADDK